MRLKVTGKEPGLQKVLLCHIAVCAGGAHLAQLHCVRVNGVGVS